MGEARSGRRAGYITIVLAVLLVGCGSGDGEETPAEGTEGSPTSTGEEVDGTATSTGEEVDATADTEPITWRWDHSLALPGTEYDEVFVELLPEILERETNGRLVLDIVYGETEPESTLEAVAAGRMDGGVLIPARYAGTFPMWDYGNIPFAFDANYDQFFEAGAEIDPIIAEDMAEQGVLNISGALPLTGNYAWTADTPIETLDDWQGLKLRSPGRQGSVFAERVGASAVTMGFGDTYSAMERGVVDGLMSTVGPTFVINVWEVSEYLNQWPLGMYSNFAIINPDSFNALPADLQATVEQVFTDLKAEAFDMVEQMNEEMIAEHQAEGVTVITPSQDELDKMREEHLDHWIDDWVSRSGPEAEAIAEIVFPGQ